MVRDRIKYAPLDYDLGSKNREKHVKIRGVAGDVVKSIRFEFCNVSGLSIGKQHNVKKDITTHGIGKC